MAPVTATEFRRNMSAYLNQVEDDNAELTVTRDGHRPVVIISEAHWNSIQETLYLLSSPANAAHINAGIASLARGEGIEMAFDPQTGTIAPAKRGAGGANAREDRLLPAGHRRPGVPRPQGAREDPVPDREHFEKSVQGHWQARTAAAGVGRVLVAPDHERAPSRVSRDGKARPADAGGCLLSVPLSRAVMRTGSSLAAINRLLRVGCTSRRAGIRPSSLRARSPRG